MRLAGKIRYQVLANLFGSIRELVHGEFHCFEHSEEWRPSQREQTYPKFWFKTWTPVFDMANRSPFDSIYYWGFKRPPNNIHRRYIEPHKTRHGSCIANSFEPNFIANLIVCRAFRLVITYRIFSMETIAPIVLLKFAPGESPEYAKIALPQSENTRPPRMPANLLRAYLQMFQFCYFERTLFGLRNNFRSCHFLEPPKLRIRTVLRFWLRSGCRSAKWFH